MAEILNPSIQRRTDGKNTSRKVLRTPHSCDRCKSRKTKCINPIPGPCVYCAGIGASCGVNIPRKSRPFYHVTEEEYRVSMRILQHHYPSRDLNLDTLKSILEDIDRKNSSDEGSRRNSAYTDASKDDLDETGELESDSEELDALHNELACLMKDSTGKYRYIGAYSEIPFNDAVCTMNMDRSSTLDGSKFISPLRTETYPPSASEAKNSSQRLPSSSPYLPPRQYCDYYVTRFFQDVHCVYWLFPIDQFFNRLDETYRKNNASSMSWLCCLYSIFALSAASSSGRLWDKAILGKANKATDTKSSLDYLALAKDLVPLMYEEADVDTIRALAILTLALQSTGLLLASWFQLGICVQIARSLGISYDHPSASQNPVSREQNRRIWWTLYLLDLSLASFGGNAFLIDKVQTPMPCDLIDPGPNNPPGCFQHRICLSRIKRQIIDTVYPTHKPDSSTITSSKIASFVSLLQEWLSSLPSHLQWTTTIKTPHRRAVSLLHLEYYSSLILLTRPFLLYIVHNNLHLPNSDRKKKWIWIDKLAEKCTEAAKQSLTILQTMSKDETLSSLTVYDSGCVLKIILISILSLWRTNMPEYRGDIESCVVLLKGMEQIGFCKTVVAELPAHLDELGICESVGDEELGGEGYEIPEQFVDFETYFSEAFDDSFLVNMELDADFLHGMGSPGKEV